MITQSRLKELLKYNRITGDFISIANRRRARAGKAVGGSTDSKGYKQLNIDGKLYRAHRLVFLYLYGSFPPYQVDHINGDRADNRRVNLRRCDAEANDKNRRMYSNNTSGVAGVCWHSRGKKWYARIKINHKYKYLGSFSDKNEAIAARKAAEVKYGFHPNHGKIRKALKSEEEG